MVVGMLMPNLIFAQGGVAGDIKSLQDVLKDLYNEMIPMCKNLISVGKGIAGFAATFYIASRIWRHIANAEPIDFYPLFRPFVLGFAIINFSLVIDMIRGIMEPTVTGTEAMVKDQDQAVATLLKMKEEAIKHTDAWEMYVGESGNGDYDKWYKYNYPNETEGLFDGIGHSIKFALAKASYNFRNSVKEWMSTVLQILFQAAALCINTIRTFYLIVLAILGPLVFGLAVFDGFQHTLTVWLARYINTFLWLPVANLFGAIIGKIQVNMLKIDLAQIGHNGDTFFSTADAGYIVFMLIGIVGYFTVPSVANYIVHPGGGSGLLHKVTSMSMMSTSSAANMSYAAGNSMVSDVYGDAKRMMGGGTQSGGGDYFKDKLSGK
jgi:conjugative transposon TraJ protein